jgi:Metalloenzyme superfamily
MHAMLRGRQRSDVQACTVVDKCLQELLALVDELKGRYLITSDHGNADDMVQRTKKGEPICAEGKAIPLTSHTLAPVGVAVGGAGLPEAAKVCPRKSPVNCVALPKGVRALSGASPEPCFVSSSSHQR